MTTDMMLVLGLVICALSLPSLLSAFSEGRAPRAGAVLLLVGGLLLVMALTQKPSGYTFAEIPHVFVRVIAGFLN